MPLTPDVLVYDTTSSADPQVSPDGTRLLYTVSRVDRAADRPVSIVGYQASTALTRVSSPGVVTPIARRAGHPTVNRSPSCPIASKAAARSLCCRWRVPVRARELTRHRHAVGHLAWSPDGQSIAYTTAYDPENPDEQPHPSCAEGTGNAAARLQAGHSGYVGDARTQVFVVDVASGERRRLTSHPHDHWYP